MARLCRRRQAYHSGTYTLLHAYVLDGDRIGSAVQYVAISMDLAWARMGLMAVCSCAAALHQFVCV
jgi:hypothetical protein